MGAATVLAVLFAACQGDWGTQFGMLIQYMSEMRPGGLDTVEEEDISDMQALYKCAALHHKACVCHALEAFSKTRQAGPREKDRESNCWTSSAR